MIVILIGSVKPTAGGFDAAHRGEGDSPRPIEAPDPVVDAHVLDAHSRAGPGRVDEAIVPEVNPDVGIRPPLGVVEHQIARFELVQTHSLAHLALRPGVMRELNAESFAVDVRHQAAAVEAVLGRLSAAPIRDARDSERLKHHLRTAGGSRRIPRGRKTATGKNQNTEKQVVTAHN